ncbi:hypothetical protein B0I35DRAFT_122659 [Stachybotrys elegans]|uniref:Uncharacterized protein n=1 Tax=Stachybotrys elegans TaxID=80388 RepID=A0A8K0WVZ2_9HYPO|nr:hypothetical protein B0I35DRAFT_122659 [Stachybotrys elegans]
MRASKRNLLTAILVFLIRHANSNSIHFRHIDAVSESVNATPPQTPSANNAQDDPKAWLLDTIQRFADNYMTPIDQATESELRFLLQHINILQARISSLLPGEVSPSLAPRDTNCVAGPPPLQPQPLVALEPPHAGAIFMSKNDVGDLQPGAQAVELEDRPDNDSHTTITLTSTMRATKTITLAYVETTSLIQASLPRGALAEPAGYDMEDEDTDIDASMGPEDRGEEVEEKETDGFTPTMRQAKFQQPTIPGPEVYVSAANYSSTALNQPLSSSSASWIPATSSGNVGKSYAEQQSNFTVRLHDAGLRSFSTVILTGRRRVETRVE